MRGRLLVSVSSVFSDTLGAVKTLVSDLDAEGIPVSLLVAPHIDGNWHLAKDADTKGWLLSQQEQGRALILNGFDQPAQGRRSEFATLGAHEARLRLAGSTRQMHKIGFDTDMFAPPRWRLSPGTLEVLPEFGFRLVASTKGLHDLHTGDFQQCRNLSVGEGFGAARWWRRNIIRAAERGAARGNTIRLSASGRNLLDKKVARDFQKAALAAVAKGADPGDYRDVATI
ncbi:DUF2334 domain-containing protein [Corynebacterium alimapuense]|uniref:DUF2334 domain-containing protein n=1 Tax=Corynebacterium alimapuense TaxID=1576874 RepID=A0A3M8K9E5_9CORY|nr:DUF2334 domain-containing protein [Corynebacterium alimapuense]RNE49841.1 DUF2334 domain-containing protein [Corynebacterium alimapuense]